MRKKSVDMPEVIWVKLKEIAESECRSIASVIREAVANYLKAKGGDNSG